MRGLRRETAVAGLLALASHAAAQVSTVCPVANKVCFKLNIPASTASSGTGDIFFQLSAPSTYQYVALGQGSGMSGANIFVVYTAGDGNVTLSPRLGSGHTEPKFNSNAQVTLLEGSGVSGGFMVANVKCSSCNSWSGGSASFSGSSGSWIYAVQSGGGALGSTSQSATITQHDEQNSFKWDYTAAKGGSSVNPLLSSGSSSGTASGTGSATSCIPRPSSSASGAAASASGASGVSSTSSGGSSPTTTQGGDDHTSRRGRSTQFTSGSTTPTGSPEHDKRDTITYCDENSNSNSNTGFTPLTSSSASREKKMLIAHGALAALAFAIFFPVGAIAIRLASFTGVVWLHAALQTFAYLVYVAAFGLGVYLANYYKVLSDKHPIIGIVVFACLFFQPILGLLHHALFKKYRTRTFWSHGHLWLGRGVITLGIVNGGFGFQLADKMRMGSKTGMIVYAVVAGIVWLIWVLASIVGERRRSKAARSPPKYTENSRVDSQERELTDIPPPPHPPHGHYAPK